MWETVQQLLRFVSWSKRFSCLLEWNFTGSFEIAVSREINLSIMHTRRQFTHQARCTTFVSGAKVLRHRRDDARVSATLIEMYLVQWWKAKPQGRRDLSGTQIDHNLCNVLHASCALTSLLCFDWPAAVILASKKKTVQAKRKCLRLHRNGIELARKGSRDNLMKSECSVVESSNGIPERFAVITQWVRFSLPRCALSRNSIPDLR